MNLKRILKIASISVLVLLIVAVAGLSIWSVTSTYPAGEIASTALESSPSVSVSQDRWFVFTPEMEPQVGVIFYPGGLVAPEAYAPVLSQLAEDGFLVVLTPMPLNLAIFNTNAANAVIEAYPDINDWVLAGHSLGGAAASIYAENHSDRMAGLVLLDSYPPDSADLSDNRIEVLSIYGTTDGMANTDNFEDKKLLLPPNTTFAPIEGASHAQFGDYGPQRGDVVPSISAADQHARVTALMVEFMEGVIP
jgi:hypothetical protein